MGKSIEVPFLTHRVVYTAVATTGRIVVTGGQLPNFLTVGKFSSGFINFSIIN